MKRGLILFRNNKQNWVPNEDTSFDAVEIYV